MFRKASGTNYKTPFLTTFMIANAELLSNYPPARQIIVLEQLGLLLSKFVPYSKEHKYANHFGS
jgi:hypothetical protein